MNKNIKLAVAGAILATASIANAGIIVPAGEWTLDIGGNVNTFASWTKQDARNSIVGGIVNENYTGNTFNTQHTNTTGLLPNFLSVSGSTRQNDLDVAFTISIQPGSTTRSAITSAGQENRQAFLTFGDKSWGSIKVGRDLGIFASDAILSDMTLLGVGAPTSSGTTTLGRIGTGYIYADWKSQISYTTPNFNGLQATVGMTQGFNASGSNTDLTSWGSTTAASGASGTYEGKASYSFAANDVTGKVWVSGIAQKVDVRGLAIAMDDTLAYGGDIGANVNAAGFGLTGYYYGGQGLGTTGFLSNAGYVHTANKTGYLRDSDGGYVQATYVLPTKTKVGVSWGVSNLDKATNEGATLVVKSNEMWTAGIYHPLTKHLNLVAEYSYLESEAQNGKKNDSNTGSLGAIMFF